MSQYHHHVTQSVNKTMYVSRIRLALKGTVIMVKGARNTTLDYLTTCLLLHTWKHKKLN